LIVFSNDNKNLLNFVIMSKEAFEPPADALKLSNKISNPTCKDDTKEIKSPNMEELLRLAVDVNKPQSPKSLLELTSHLRGHMADAPLCSLDKLATAFGLTAASEGKKFLVKASNTDVIRIKDDEARSARHMFEMACVKIAMELEGGRVIYPTFNLHSRRAHINALKPYGEEVDDHYLVYLERINSKPEVQEDVPISFEELIDDDTGETKFNKLEAGKSYSTGSPDRSKLKALLEYCEKSLISIKFRVAKVWIANECVKAHPRLKLISEGPEPIIAYEANKRHLAYPLAPGPESEEDLNKLINKLKDWITSGVCAYTPVSLEAPIGAGKSCSKNMIIFQAMLSEKKPGESVFEAVPKHVKDLYNEALLAGPKGAKAVLEQNNIVGGNPAIYHQDHIARKLLPPVVVSTVQKVMNSLPSPNARLILKYVHFVLATKEIYEGKETVIARLPKDPWLASINMICRHLEKYNLQDVVKTDGGDIYPRIWLMSKGKTVQSREIKRRLAAKASSRKPNEPEKPRFQGRGGGVAGHPRVVVSGRNGQPPKALPGLKTFQSRNKAGVPGVVTPGRFMTDQQLAQLAQSAGQSAIQAMLVANQPEPAFTYQSCDWSEETSASTANS